MAMKRFCEESAVCLAVFVADVLLARCAVLLARCCPFLKERIGAS
jgi:hypothetical protein